MERECRICQDPESNEELIEPCTCSGSLAYVHQSCLKAWRVASNKPNATTHCDVCGDKFLMAFVGDGDATWSKTKARMKFFAVVALDMLISVSIFAAIQSFFFAIFWLSDPGAVFGTRLLVALGRESSMEIGRAFGALISSTVIMLAFITVVSILTLTCLTAILSAREPRTRYRGGLSDDFWFWMYITRPTSGGSCSSRSSGKKSKSDSDGLAIFLIALAVIGIAICIFVFGGILLYSIYWHANRVRKQHMTGEWIVLDKNRAAENVVY